VRFCAAEIVTPAFAVIRPFAVNVPLVVRLAPSAVKAVDPCELMTTLPVVSPPIVKVLFKRLWILDPSAFRTNPLPVEPERVATGVSLPIPVTAKAAD